MSHHLQFIISSKDLENLKKSLCTRDKAENQYMPVFEYQHDSVMELAAWAQEQSSKEEGILLVKAQLKWMVAK